MLEGFVYLDEALPGIFWDAKYATPDNFTGAVVDGYLTNRVVGTREMAEALKAAKRLAAAKGFGLFLFDGYRPQRAVDRFLRWAASPEDGRTKDRHYPNIDKADIVPLGYVAVRSGHSRGSAIDLTLCDPSTGCPAEMGGGFDLMDVCSHHGAEGIAPEAARNRETLRGIMEASGFSAYALEWWHYGLVDEPYPDRYFDFPIEQEER
jgi:D-alanyl-D-alanine dipeptidase